VGRSSYRTTCEVQREKEAQEHCPGGLVVWLDLSSKVYYFRGQQMYGFTRNGATSIAMRQRVRDAGQPEFAMIRAESAHDEC